MEIDNMLHLLGISHQNWRRGWTNSNSETFCLLTSDIWMYLKSSVVKKLFKWKILITLGDYGSFCCTHVGRNRDSRMEIQWDVKKQKHLIFLCNFFAYLSPSCFTKGRELSCCCVRFPILLLFVLVCVWLGVADNNAK